MRRASYWAVLFLPLIAGCSNDPSEPGVIVTGKLHRQGRPLVVPSSESGGFIALQLCPRDVRPGISPGDGANGVYAPDGSVRFTYAGKGVRPGKYLLTIELSDGTIDLLAGQYGIDRSTLEVVVPENKLGGTFDFGTIDLD